MPGETTPHRDALPRLGFIGLGTMGSRMCQRLLAAGYPLTVFNRTRSRAKPLLSQGATWASTPKELAARSDIVLSSLSNDAVVRGMYLGRDGVGEGAAPGTLCLDLSTVAPDTARQIAEVLRARDVAMLDTPVSGSVPQVESGSLVIFVGGEESARERASPLLSVLGKTTFHMGGNGMGATMKLVVNALLGSSLQSLAEAIVLGERAGLEKPRLLEVLGQTAVVAPNHRVKLENVAQEEYPVAFSLQLMHKDFGLIMALAHRLAVAMPATAVADQMCAAEVARHHQEDMSATIELMEELAGTLPTQH